MASANYSDITGRVIGHWSGGGGGGSQPAVTWHGPYPLTAAMVAALFDTDHAYVPLGFTPTGGDLLLDVIWVPREAFDQSARVDSASDGLNIGADAVNYNSLDLTVAAAGTNLLLSGSGTAYPLSVIEFDVIQGSAAILPALVAVAAEAIARVVADAAPSVGSADFYFATATPVAP